MDDIDPTYEEVKNSVQPFLDTVLNNGWLLEFQSATILEWFSNLEKYGNQYDVTEIDSVDKLQQVFGETEDL